MDIEKIKALFNTYFVDVLKNHYTDFNGRANRPQYWYFVLFVSSAWFWASLTAYCSAGRFSA